MKKITIFICFICGVSLAGVEDFFIYDESERGGTNFTAIVTVSVNNFYALSERDLIYTFGMEKEGALLERENGWRQRSMAQDFWNPWPDMNARSILIRHTIWILDANIMKCFHGEIATNRCFIAMKKTPPFEGYAPPELILEKGVENIPTNVVLGLVEIDREDFIRSFRNKTVYMQNNLDYLQLTTKKDASEIYPSVIKAVSGGGVEKIDIAVPCFVARDIGFRYTSSSESGRALRELSKIFKKEYGKKPLLEWIEPVEENLELSAEEKNELM